MYRPRDITDSIATVVIILMIVITLAYILITSLGFQIPDLKSAGDDLNPSSLEPLFKMPLGIDISSMDGPSKIIFGAVLVLVVFLLVAFCWIWYRYGGKKK